jgi:hypothetical protein
MTCRQNHINIASSMDWQLKHMLQLASSCITGLLGRNACCHQSVAQSMHTHSEYAAVPSTVYGHESPAICITVSAAAAILNCATRKAQDPQRSELGGRFRIGSATPTVCRACASAL